MERVTILAKDKMPVSKVSSNEETGVVETGWPDADADGAFVDAVVVNEDLVVIMGLSKLSSLDDASMAAISSAKVILSVKTV